jgi:hypothetical protein
MTNSQSQNQFLFAAVGIVDVVTKLTQYYIIRDDKLDDLLEQNRTKYDGTKNRQRPYISSGPNSGFSCPKTVDTVQ